SICVNRRLSAAQNIFGNLPAERSRANRSVAGLLQASTSGKLIKRHRAVEQEFSATNTHGWTRMDKKGPTGYLLSRGPKKRGTRPFHVLRVAGRTDHAGFIRGQ